MLSVTEQSRSNLILGEFFEYHTESSLIAEAKNTVMERSRNGHNYIL